MNIPLELSSLKCMCLEWPILYHPGGAKTMIRFHPDCPFHGVNSPKFGKIWAYPGQSQEAGRIRSETPLETMARVTSRAGAILLCRD